MNQPEKIFDALLVLECQAGSKKAMTLLVKRWHPKLCKQAYWYTKDSDQAKDIAQDSWNVILNKIQFLKDPSSFGSWAMKITTRKSIDWLRKQKKTQDTINNSFELANATIGDDVASIDSNVLKIKELISKLPQKQQMVLHLFYLEEFSINQISMALEISTGTVKSRLFTAREKLKAIIKNRNHEK